MTIDPHPISKPPRARRPRAEDCARLRVRDLRGRFGWFATHEIRAPDGSTVKLRLDLGERHGWARVENWRAGAGWASSSYDLPLFAREQPFGGLAWTFQCPMSGTRTPVLYLPAGARCLGSREAHKLSYQSQRRDGPARAAARAQRLAADLGSIGPDGAPTRPRGMWRSTFARRSAALALALEAGAADYRADTGN